MKHKPTPIRSKPARHNGPTGSDTNKRNIYRVSFTYKQCGDRFIEAASAEEARTKAKSIPRVEPGFWRDWPWEFTVIEVDAIERKAMPKDATLLPIPD